MHNLLRHIADCIAATFLALAAMPIAGLIVYHCGARATGIAILNLFHAICFAAIP